MTRAKVIQLGFLVLLAGGLGYFLFGLAGLDGQSAGIASEAVLIFGVLIWTASYLFRVFSGQMTFMEQRKRYRREYEKLTADELQAKFEKMSDEDKLSLLKELEIDENTI